MVGLFIIIVFIIWCCCHESPTAKCYREGKEAFERQSRNIEAYRTSVSVEHDVYQDPATKWIDYNFYRDGSLKYEGDKIYPKGKYRCNSYGYGPFGKPVPSTTPRPPKH